MSFKLIKNYNKSYKIVEIFLPGQLMEHKIVFNIKCSLEINEIFTLNTIFAQLGGYGWSLIIFHGRVLIKGFVALTKNF